MPHGSHHGPLNFSFERGGLSVEALVVTSFDEDSRSITKPLVCSHLTLNSNRPGGPARPRIFLFFLGGMFEDQKVCHRVLYLNLSIFTFQLCGSFLVVLGIYDIRDSYHCVQDCIL